MQQPLKAGNAALQQIHAWPMPPAPQQPACASGGAPGVQQLCCFASAATQPQHHHVQASTCTPCTLHGPLQAEFTPLDTWVRHSSLFDLLTNIGFYRNFLAGRAFKRWHKVCGCRRGSVGVYVALCAQSINTDCCTRCDACVGICFTALHASCFDLAGLLHPTGAAAQQLSARTLRTGQPLAAGQASFQSGAEGDFGGRHRLEYRALCCAGAQPHLHAGGVWGAAGG